MTESTRKKVISGVLVVAVIWGYANLKPDSDGKKPSRRDTKTAVQQQATATPKPSIEQAPKLVRIEEKAKESWGEDPFRVEKKQRVGVSHKPNRVLKWTLSGILYNSHSPTAIINRQQVKSGGTVDGARVIKIDKKAVTLEHNGKQMTITVTKG